MASEARERKKALRYAQSRLHEVYGNQTTDLKDECLVYQQITST